MSTRLEALRLAVTLNSDADKVVATAEKFNAFLDPIGTQTAQSSNVGTTKVETPAESVKEPAAETTTTSTPEVDIKTRVQELAKVLVKKDRPKLLAALKTLGFEKASLISTEKLPEAETLFKQALAA